MKRSASGRVARKIGAYEEDSAEGTATSTSGAQSRPTETVVKRPAFSKGKKRSSLRISFGAGDADVNDGDESSDTTVLTPKKSSLSRIAIEKNAERKTRSPLVPALLRVSVDEDRPTYNKDHLAELRNSTPSTPKDLIATSDDVDESQALDIASKFGPTASLSTEAPSAIPTEAQIQEKKARRARLGKEQRAYDEDEDQPWASDDDDEFRTSRNEISLRPKDKYAETRLVRDDEDIAEGFEDYVEDGRISLGRKAEREAQEQRRTEMADMINNAEGGSDDDGTEDSEAERNAAYEAAQTRAGAYGWKQQQDDDGANTPPRITPLLDLGEIFELHQAKFRSLQQKRDMILKQMEELKDHKVHIADRQKYIQEQVQKMGEEFEKLRVEAGMAAVPINGGEGGRLIVDRGLDSLGTTPMGTTPAELRSEEESDSDSE